MLLEAGDRVTGPLRAIAGGSTKAAQALRLTRAGLKAIERAQGDIAGFRALKAGLRSTEQQMQSARQKAAALGRQMAETAEPTRAMTREFAKSKAEAAKLERQHQAETRELGTLRERLREAGVATTDLARHERTLRNSARETNEEIAEQERRVSRLADRERRMATGRARFARMQGVATGLAAGGAAAIGTGMAMATPLLGSIKAAQEYQSVMTDIGQKAGLSRAATDKMGKSLLVAARAANQMPADMQRGVDTLAGLGASVPDAMQMMPSIGKASTAYKAEVGDMAAATFAAKDNLKVAVGQTGKVIDIMAQSGKRGAFELKDMAAQFPALTAAYQSLGQSGTGAVADLAAGAQIARKGAGNSEMAGNNLLNLLNKINAKDTNDNFKKFGVDLPKALEKAAKDGKGPIQAITELTNSTLKGDTKKLSYLFGDAQVQAALRPLMANMEEYKIIRKESLAASGTTDRDFAERMKDSAAQSQALKVNAATLAVTLGTMLLPTINAVVNRANGFATWIGDIANRYPNATKAVAVGAAAFAGLFLILGGGAIVIAGLVAPFSALAFAAGALGIGMLPVIGIALGVVAGIVAIGAAAYLIYANWGAISGWFAGVWNGIKAGFAGGIAGVAGMLLNFSPVGLVYSGVAALLSLFGVQLPARLTEAGRHMMQGLVNGLLSGLRWVVSAVTSVASTASGAFRRALGIKSPSRVFMGFGGHIVDGLTNGIAAQEGEPVRRMDRLSSRLTAAMVTGSAIPAMAMAGPASTASSPAGNAGASSSSYVIHINQQPGQDGQALARAVADELDRRDRETAARGRSSFADTPDYETV
ncbi:phage tail tape measure protein [Sphingomonas sp. Leaf230]|nr:phage tail tape measure protein [Sphingomonas sp. Leaf230]